MTGSCWRRNRERETVRERRIQAQREDAVVHRLGVIPWVTMAGAGVGAGSK